MYSILNSVEERAHALQIADRQSNEDLDEVKRIRSQMVASEARTIRDGQLVERAAQRAAEREAEREWAEQLEANRREAVQFYDARETTLRDQRRAGRTVIQAQIEERTVNAILEAERLDRESRALREQNAAVAEEDRTIAAARAARKRAFLADCLAANELQRRKRAELRQLEKDEVQMTIEVQAQRALAEAAIEKEKDDQKALKEREIAEIRRKQERATDTQALRDEAAAAKIQQEKDAADRAREEAQAAARRQQTLACRDDHEMMIAQKRERMIEQATIERAEFERVMAANRKAQERARERAEKKAEEDRRYREGLGEEVEHVWRARQGDPAMKGKERNALTDANAAYLARVGAVRDQKIEILRKKGVPEKYLTEIRTDRLEIR
jgi:fused signal recognition particle receptor